MPRIALSLTIILVIVMGGAALSPLTSAVYPPADITIIQSPDASDSFSTVTIGTPITYTITARDPDVPPVASLAFTIYWDYFAANFSPGNRDLKDVVTAATNASGHGTATVTHTYVDIGPHQQADRNDDGTMDIGGWFMWVEVDDGVDGLGISAAYSFMTLPPANEPPIITVGLPSIWNTVVNPPNHTFPVTLSFFVRDPEGDHLNVTWEYGDGSQETMYVGPAPQETAVSTTHTYDANVTLTPAYHNWTLRATVDDGHDHPVVVGPTRISMYVTLDSGPVFEGDITFTPTFGDPSYTYNGIALNFTVTARDSNGDPLYYSWDFNNDTTIDALGSRVSWILQDTGTHIPHPTYGDLNWSLHEVRAFVSDGYWKLPADAHNQSRNIQVWSRDNARVLLTPLPTFNNTFNATLEQPLTFTWQVFDADGDNVSFAVEYGDGSQVEIIAGIRNNSFDPPGFYNLTFNHSYSFSTCRERGNYSTLYGKQVIIGSSFCIYRLNITVSDGHNLPIRVKPLVFAGSVNQPPIFTEFLASQPGSEQFGYFITNQAVNFTIRELRDPEGDTVYLTIYYGDGTSATMEVKNTSGARDVVFTHIYTSKPPEGLEFYTVRLEITDRRVGIFDHNPAQTYSTKVEDPFILTEVPPWDILDYASLAAVLTVPPVLLVLGRWRSAKEEEEEV